MAILRVSDDVPKLPNVGYTHACVRLGPDHAIGVKVSLTVNHIVNWTMFSLTFVGLWRHSRPRAIGLMRVLWAQVCNRSMASRPLSQVLTSIVEFCSSCFGDGA